MKNEEMKRQEEESRKAWHDLGEAFLEVMEELVDVVEDHPYR